MKMSSAAHARLKSRLAKSVSAAAAPFPISTFNIAIHQSLRFQINAVYAHSVRIAAHAFPPDHPPIRLPQSHSTLGGIVSLRRHVSIWNPFGVPTRVPSSKSAQNSAISLLEKSRVPTRADTPGWPCVNP